MHWICSLFKVRGLETKDTYFHRCRNGHTFGGAKEFCPVSPKFARKILDFQKKLFMSIRAPCETALHVHLGRISCQFGRYYFQIKAFWAPFMLRFSGSFKRFSEILPGFYKILLGFYKILPGFSPNQNLSMSIKYRLADKLQLFRVLFWSQ